MNGFTVNIEEETSKNTDYRRVSYTAAHIQLVLMNVKPGEEIGEEVHTVDQFIRIEEGQASVELNKGETKYSMKDGWVVIIPAGTIHNVINTGDKDLKLYTLYSPPQHQKDTFQPTKADEKEEAFDGQISE